MMENWLWHFTQFMVGFCQTAKTTTFSERKMNSLQALCPRLCAWPRVKLQWTFGNPKASWDSCDSWILAVIHLSGFAVCHVCHLTALPLARIRGLLLPFSSAWMPKPKRGASQLWSVAHQIYICFPPLINRNSFSLQPATWFTQDLESRIAQVHAAGTGSS